MKTAFTTLGNLKLNADINPRSASNENLEGLMAQIRSHGCIGHLWVRPGKKKDSFEVIDGSRRYRALNMLSQAGEWKKDAKIPITIFTATDAEARDLALAANFEREPLSPADEAIGFTRLTLSGMAVADIAAHYAVTEKLVRQRIAIGSLPAVILQALREGVIDIGTAQVFAGFASPERAKKTFDALLKKKTLRRHDVEQALTDGTIDGSDRRCVFVGSEAYEAGGGTITRDLFSANEMWSDEKLLDALFEEKIAATAQALKDEGWSFVEVLRKNTWNISSWAKSVASEKRELSKDEKAELKKLKAELKSNQDEDEALQKKYDDSVDSWSDTDDRRFEELEDLQPTLKEKIEALETPVFTSRQLKKAGCVITVGDHGERVKILRGLIKPGQSKAKNGADRDDEDDDPASPDRPASETVGYSDALTTLLELEAQKATKLAMVLHKPALTARMGLAARIIAATEHAHDAPFKVHHNDQHSGDTFARIRAAGLKPFDESYSFISIVGWLETLTPEEIMLIEAYLAADTFTVSSLRNEDVKAVIAAIDPDMTAEGWKPDLEFMGRLNRAQLLVVIGECEPTFKMPASSKKAELVDEAAGRAQATGWLPPPLRTPSYKGPGSNAWADARAAQSAEEISQQHPPTQDASADLRAEE